MHEFLEREKEIYNEHIILNLDFKSYLDGIKMKIEELGISDNMQQQAPMASPGDRSMREKPAESGSQSYSAITNSQSKKNNP